MRLRTAKQIHYDAGPNMTPLVDVVMVILIFMMLAGTFAGSEWYLVSNLPLRQTGGGAVKPPPGGFPEDEPLEIRVDPNTTHDGYIARVGQIQTGNADELKGALVAMRDRFAATRKTADKVQVIISPSKTLKYQQIVEVYQAVLNAQFVKVGFGTSR